MRYQQYDDDELLKRKVRWSILKTLLPRFKPHLKSLGFCGFLLASFSLLSLSGPLLVRHAIDVNFVQKDLHGLLITAGLFFLVLILSFFFNYLQMIRLEMVGQKIVKSIRIDIFAHLTQLPQSFFDKNPVGQLLSRVENDTEALRTLFTSTVVSILSDLIMMCGMLVVMLRLSPRLAVIIFALAPFVVILIRYFNRRLVPIFYAVRRQTAMVYGFLEEYIRGSRIVQAFDQVHNVSGQMNAVNKRKYDVEFPGEKLSNYFGHSVFLLSTVATSLILAFGGHWVLMRPDLLSIGTLVAFLGYIDRFFGPIFHLSEQLNIIQRALAGAERIQEILATPGQSFEQRSQSECEAEKAVEQIAGIEFKDVSFAYKDEHWVLNNVSFSLPRGKRFAIVGPTGSGKTTLISLLLRFYDPQQGTILLDGIDIRTMPLTDLRRQIGLVLQDLVLFHGSILDNLRLEDTSISEAEVMKALEMANARHIVQRSQEGVQAMVSEGGANLSVGERQLLNFARALLFNPDILILDEATSSVDPLTEKLIQKAISKMLTGRTALIIAHRLETILECDEILVLHHGRIVERGTHDELIKNEGVYWNFFQIQSGLGKVMT